MKQLKNNELKVVVGGNRWGDAVLGGLGMAGTGVKACKFGGPWLMTACGVVGGAVGAYLGYTKN